MQKLLILGSKSRAIIEMIAEAKNRGMYTIITDNNPVEKAPNKLLADEFWMISTTDTDTLEKKCIESKVTAVICGISQFNTTRTLDLCERLGLKHYATPESWHYTVNKRDFKNLCRKHGVPVSKDYFVSKIPTENELNKIEFPVVVKAINLGGGRGMTYCNNKDDVLRGCEVARTMSGRDDIIIEKKMIGREYAAWYVMAKGEVKLLSFCAMVSQTGFPGHFYSVTTSCTDRKTQFLEEINPYFINAIKDAGCKEGLCWIEMMVDEDDNHLYVLEMGYRLSGDMIALPFCKTYGFNSYSWLIDIACGIEHGVADLPTGGGCKENGYAVSYVLWSRDSGIISEISGYENIQDIPYINIDSGHRVGSTVVRGSILAVITFVASSAKEECEIICRINDAVSIKNEEKDIVVRFTDFDVLMQMEDDL